MRRPRIRTITHRPDGAVSAARAAELLGVDVCAVHHYARRGMLRLLSITRTTVGRRSRNRRHWAMLEDVVRLAACRDPSVPRGCSRSPYLSRRAA